MGQRDDGLGRQRLVPEQELSQCVIHRRFVLAGGLLEDPQIRARAHRRRVFLAQPIVGQAETAVGEQVLAIPIVFESAGLADQSINDVPIVDRVLVTTHQTRQRVHLTARMPDLDAVRIEPGFHLLADQAAVDGIHVAMDADQAPWADTHFHAQAAVQTLFRQRLQQRPLFLVPPTTRGVPFSHDVPQERQQLVMAGEVAAAS